MATIYESPEIQALGNLWAEKKKAGASQSELDAIHEAAESLRKQQGYESTSSSASNFQTTGTKQSYAPNYKSPEDLVKEYIESYEAKSKTNADAAKQQYIDGQLAKLTQNYNTNLSNLEKAYKDNLTLGQQQLKDVETNYNKNISDMYDNIYSQRKQSAQNASKNGITSLGQAQSAANALLYKAADTASDRVAERDQLKSNIQTELNNLAEDYNIDKATLKKNFDAAELETMSTGELAYLEQILNIDKYGADFWTDLLQTEANQNWQSSEAQKDREWQSTEAQKDRDFKIMLEQMFGSGFGGNYSGSPKEDLDVSDLAYALEYETQNVPKDEIERFAAMLIGVEQGRYKKSDVAALINNTIKKYNYSANNPDWAHKNNVSSLTDSYDKYITSQIR